MGMGKSDRIGRWLLSLFGVFIVVYSLLVLGFIATTPDLGLRCLMIKSGDVSIEGGSSQPNGIAIQRFVSATGALEGANPKSGDRLLEIARQPIATFMDFTRQLAALRNAEIPPGGHLYSDADVRTEGDLLPPIVQNSAGERYVEVRFRHGREARRSWLRLRNLPVREVAVSIVWFVLQFCILTVSALAFWTRPFDRQARLFFSMCVVTLGAFTGGTHWWLIAYNVWLTIPFVVCALLLPVVTLHFFLTYPQLHTLLSRFPRPTLVAIYLLPALVTVLFVGGIAYSAWRYDRAAPAGEIHTILATIDDGIYGAIGLAAAYFLATIVVLVNSFFTTRTPLLRRQVQWILWAALIATVPVGYTLYLARFQKEQFALGAHSLPMFAASLLFMLAYAVGIARYKLMLIDEVLSRGMWYYVVSLLVTVGFSAVIATGGLVAMYHERRIGQNVVPVGVLAVVAVLLINWGRERLQRMVDRRFFREKFQLDKALQRMNASVERAADPGTLAERMLACCLDLLGVDRAALYLRDATRGVLQLTASVGIDDVPLDIEDDRELLTVLAGESGGQVGAGSAADSPAPLWLRKLDIDLLHALELDGNLAGVLLLGTKRNGTPYTAEDLALLTSLGQITTVAVHSARAHQAAARLSDELQAKTDKIAEQQRLISMMQTEIVSRQQTGVAAEEPAFRRELIKGSSLAIQRVLETVRKVSGSQSSVLIRGESGTGKELLALALHENSPRRDGPMISVHCGALSAGLLESELFGHVKGAFTGAHRDKVGRFELANGGTLFLDEIGDISLETQIKLLRVLQQREFEPVGGSHTVQVDVRLIAATHQNLERLIAEGKFREDLYYRLNVISITLPPLRERLDDLFELAVHFLARAATRSGKLITHLEDEALEALKQYGWPGNIRELENAIERAVVLAEGPAVTLADLPPAISERGADALRDPVVNDDFHRAHDSPARRRTKRERAAANATGEQPQQSPAAERDALIAALASCGGNKAQAARRLGMPRSTFFSKLKKYSLE
jgi:transcriptional regulator with GAF, ATPase, and Fis domain